MPLLEKDFYQKYNSRGLEVIAVELNGDKGKIENALSDFRPSYPILIGSESGVARDYGIIPVPVNLVIDKKGFITYRGIGYNPNAIRKAIEELL